MAYVQQYILESFPVQVTENGTWGQKDVPNVYVDGVAAVGDTVEDNGEVPLYATIRCIDDQTHSICATSLKIASQSPSGDIVIQENSTVPENGYEADTIDTSAHQCTWESGVNNIVLPDGVLKVVMIDKIDKGSFINANSECSSYNEPVGIKYNTIDLLVYLDPSFELGSENIDAIIDIDGNAKLLCGQEGSGIPKKCRITVELVGQQSSGGLQQVTYDGEPHCSISLYPWGSNEPTQGTTFQMSVNEPGSGYHSGTRCPAHKATIGFSPPTNNVGLVNTTQLRGNTINYSPYWFYIVPDDGYTISRHLLSIEKVSASTQQVNNEFYGDYTSLTNITYGAVSLPYMQQSALYNGFGGGPPSDNPGDFYFFGNPNCSYQETSYTNVAGYGFPPYGIGTGGINTGNISLSGPTSEGGVPTSIEPTSQSVLDSWQLNAPNQYYGVTCVSNIKVYVKEQANGSFVEQSYSSIPKGSGGASLGIVYDDNPFSSNNQGFQTNTAPPHDIQIIDSTVQDSSNPTEFGQYGSGYEFGVIGVPGVQSYVLPDTHCPSDFIDNKIIVGIEDITRIQPGQMNFPFEIKIKLIGAAVELTDEECVPCEFDIEC